MVGQRHVAPAGRVVASWPPNPAPAMPTRRPGKAAQPHEHLDPVHPPSDRDLAADGGDRAGRHRRLSVAAGGAAAAGRFPDHQRQRQVSRRQPGDHGDHGGAAAGAAVRADPRRRADDLGQRAGADADHAAVRPQPQHRRRRADVQAAINAASGQLPKNLPQPPTYLQGEPVRRADPDPGGAVRRVADDRRSTTTPTTSWRSRSSQISGVSRCSSAASRSARCACRSIRRKLAAMGMTLEDVRGVAVNATVDAPKGTIDGDDAASRSMTTTS